MKAPNQVNKVQKKKPDKKKVKKNVLKPSLDSPFCLSWPSLNFKQSSEVVSALQDSLSQFSERESQDEVSTTEPQKNSEVAACKSAANPYMIFGFNAVMRGIEKGKIACVLVNANAKPDMLLKSFIPVCNLKFIPLIPIKELSEIVRKLFGIKSTLSLGLLKASCEDKGRCRLLYAKCCTALGLNHLLNSNTNSNSSKNSKSNLKSSEKSTADLKAFENPPAQPATKEEIKACHLHRDNKSERVFKPPKSCLVPGSNILGGSSSFIGINESKESSSDPSHFRRKKVERKASSDAVECAFFIDNDGEMKEEVEDQMVGVEEQKTGGENVKEPELVESSSKRKNDMPQFSYVPAKMKRVKANPKRR